MSDKYRFKHRFVPFVIVSGLAALLMALLLTIQGWKSGFAQVADWCNQPGIIWCTSHEEFAINTNLPTGSYLTPYPHTNDPSWYARPTPDVSGGGVDRNDDQYGTPTPGAVESGLPARIVEVSTGIPARNGETTNKRYLELNADTVFADTNLDANHQSNNNTNAGIFLSRKVRGADVNLVNVGDGLYFSAWYRFPQMYESTRPGENNNLMVMEFMNERSNGAGWKVPWSIHLNYDDNQGKMFFRVDERSYTLALNYPDSLIQHTDSTLAIPINQWVHLEVFYKYGNYTTSESITGGIRGKSDGGQVIVFQDGIEIYRFDDVATTTKAGDTAWVSDRWMVTAYAAADGAANPTPNPQTSPTNFQVLVDDAAISTVRLGGARELISNGDFETLANWRIDDDTLATDSLESAGMSANSPSAAKLARTIGANPTDLYDPSFYQTVAGGLSKGATYTLRFSAKAATAGRTIQALLLENSYNCCGGSSNDQWTEYWNDSCGVVSLGTTMQNYVCTFTADYASNSVNLVFRLGGNHNTIWLDNVSLVQNNNLIRNGDFSDTTTSRGLSI